MIYDLRVAVLIALYRAETWSMTVAEKKRLNVMEMKCLKSMCGIMHMDRVKNKELQKRTGVTSWLVKQSRQSMMRWFGQMERMEEDQLVKRILGSNVRGVRLTGRPQWNEWRV